MSPSQPPGKKATAKWTGRWAALGAAVVVVPLLLAPAVGRAGSGHFSRELHHLMAAYPAIKAKMLEKDAAGMDREAAAAAKFPTASVSADAGYEKTDTPRLGLWRKQGALTLTQNVFDGWRTRFQVKSSEAVERATEADLTATRLAILFEGMQGYLNAILQRKLVSISERNVETVERILGFIEAEVEAGRLGNADLLQARARRAQANEALLAAEGQLKSAGARYRKLFERVPVFADMEDPLVPANLLPQTLPAALGHARERNPLIAAAEHLADAAVAQRSVAEADLFPSVDVEATGEYKSHVDGATTSDTEGSLLLKFNWDLTGGLTAKPATEAANKRHASALQTLHQNHREVEEQVRVAWDTVDVQRRRLGALAEAEAIAVEALEVRTELMKAGKETIIVVLDTALEVLNVKIAMISADYGYRLSVYQLLIATGQLGPDTIDAFVVGAPLTDIEYPRPFRDGLPGLDKPQTAATQMTEAPAAPPAPPPADAEYEFAPPSAEKETDADDLLSLTPDPGTQAELAPDDILALTPDPAPAVATAPAAPAPGEVLVGLGSFVEARNARDRILVSGFDDARIVMVSAGGREFHRVVVGPMSKAEASEVMARVKGLGIRDAWVVTK